MLVAIADACDDQGRCGNGVKHLAKKCNVTTRQAQRQIGILEKLGELLVQQGKDCGGYKTRNGWTNLYVIPAVATMKVTNARPVVRKRTRKGVTDMTPLEEPKMSPLENEGLPKVSPQGMTDMTPQEVTDLSSDPNMEPSREPNTKNIAPDGAQAAPATSEVETDGAAPSPVDDNPIQEPAEPDSPPGDPTTDDDPFDDDIDPTAVLYACTPEDIAEFIAIWFAWTPVRPTNKKGEISLSSHIANKTNRALAEKLWRKGVRPGDLIQGVMDMKFEDRLPPGEINFVYAAKVADGYARRDRGGGFGANFYTRDCPRVLGRKPGARIDDPNAPYDELIANPDALVEIPPPYVDDEPTDEDDIDAGESYPPVTEEEVLEKWPI